MPSNDRSLVLLKILDLALVLFGLFEGVEGPQVALLPGGGVFLSGVEAVFSGF